MKEKDQQIVKDSIDVAISKIPGLNVAWELSKALYGSGLKLRRQRAFEWVEMVKNNPSIFVKEVLEDEKFQDGFVFALEKYIRERNKEKRQYYRNIFLGFAKGNNKSDFELERFFYVLSLLDEFAIDTLKHVDIHTPNSYKLFEDRERIQDIYTLINTGILFLDPEPRIGPIHSPFVYTSDFGRKFILYLRNEI